MEKTTSIPALREKLLKQRLTDAWWVAVDDVPQERPLRLRSIEDMIRANPDAEYQILHTDAADRGEMDWCPVYLAPRLRSSKPAQAEPNLDHSALVDRIVTLETSQQTLIQAVARLNDLLERVLVEREFTPSQRPEAPAFVPANMRDAEEVSDSFALDRDYIKNAQLRDKAKGFRLVS